ncbi:class I SAM-dependent methyltransferase family protein [Candidatus Woesearchaeota archaeon]|nr:class I SAM-dependent methyltransferase family protein [Candidatus Woesearchaeota archaeon]
MATLKQALEKELTKKEMETLVASYDIVGSIAIIEIPPLLRKKEKLIAKTLMSLHKNIKTVLKKAGIHKGKYRRQKLRFLAGKRTKIAEYKENNARFRIDVEKVYFSPRSSTERKRISELVTPGEEVLVMFSGCAPLPVVISKNTKAKEIYGIELNPVAHKFALQNVELNKLRNITLFNGDVKVIVPKLKKKFDRILMPLPKDAQTFLGAAFKTAKKGATIHLYRFAHIDEFERVKKKVEDICAQNKKKCKIIRLVKCGAYSPKVYRVCIDFKILS